MRTRRQHSPRAMVSAGSQWAPFKATKMAPILFVQETPAPDADRVVVRSPSKTYTLSLSSLLGNYVCTGVGESPKVAPLPNALRRLPAVVAAVPVETAPEPIAPAPEALGVEVYGIVQTIPPTDPAMLPAKSPGYPAHDCGKPMVPPDLAPGSETPKDSLYCTGCGHPVHATAEQRMRAQGAASYERKAAR